MGRNYSLPRTPCRLCQERIVWCEFVDGRKVAVNPNPVDPSVGSLGRIRPDMVDGEINVVETVPEERRWMKDKLYQPHQQTCRGYKLCKQVGIFKYQECERHLHADAPTKVGMTQTVREAKEPARYRVDRNA